MKLEYIATTFPDNTRNIQRTQVPFVKDNGQERQAVNLHPDVEFQTFEGFGGAFTDSAGYVYAQMNQKDKERMLSSYFGTDQMNYRLGRVHADSCDFSVNQYEAMSDSADRALNSFTLDRTRQYVIPMVKDAEKVLTLPVELMLSPWSPPAFMKTNGERCHGGKLKPEYRDFWADYLCRYIRELRAEGLNIRRMSIQNEPKAVQTWDSCIYSPEEERDFLKDHLHPALVRHGLENVEVFIWDHNKERLYERACVILDKETAPMVAGLAFHWYSGDHFEALELVRKRFPDKKLILSEACIEYSMANIPMDKAILRQFLKSGFMEKGKLFPTETGTPQGGTISTVICNMVLDGIEPLLKAHFFRKWVNGKMYNPKVNFTRYADDFIVTGASPELLRQDVKPLLQKFLLERGLTLSEEKTVITHIDDGFDFLGCNVRKFNGKLLTRPSKAGIKAFLAKVRGIIRQNKSAQQKDLIMRLNPVIRGWVNFHRFNVSSKAFHYVDAQIFFALWRWAKRRHHNKGARWIAKRYFHRVYHRTWTFSCQWRREDGEVGYYALEYASDTKIARFPAVRDGANPYDEAWQLYFEERETEKMRVSVKGNHTLRRLFNKQKGLCALCGERLTLETGGRCHKYRFGRQTANYLVHPDCHRKIHAFQTLQPAYCGSDRL